LGRRLANEPLVELHSILVGLKKLKNAFNRMSFGTTAWNNSKSTGDS
jgi:hypothetical protein